MSSPDPHGWEPAAFQLECPHGHEWTIGGQYHRASGDAWPERDVCPNRGCGLPHWIATVYTGDQAALVHA